MLVPAPALRFLACLLALVPFSLPAWAQDPTPTPAPLQMALSSPLAATAKPLSLIARRGKWFPVAATLSNTGDPVSGTLHLRLVANGEFDNPPNDVYCQVDMPTNAHKVVWLYGRMDRANVAWVEISFTGRGFPNIVERVQVQEPEDGQRVVVSISDNDTGLSGVLRSLNGPGLSLNGAAQPTGFNPSGSQGPIRPFETPRENVPDRWFGLEAADMVVLGDFPHNSLLPPQIEALRGYVNGGGTMLVMGGSNAQRLRTSALADLWPGQVGSSTTGSAGEVASVVNRYVPNPLNGADRLGGAPMVVTRTTLKPAATLHAGTMAQPLFSSINDGAGRVLFLGFDPSQPPFNGWSGQLALWQDIFATTQPLRRLDGADRDYVNMGSMPNNPYGGNYGGYNYNYGQNQSSSPTSGLLNALSKAPQLSMPPVSQIAWFLSLYVFVLVPLNYTILRVIDRRELAWVTIPVIVAAFSVFAYAAALSIRGTAILTRQVDVVQGTLGSNMARTDSLLWLFSPKKTTYDVSSSNRNASIADYANDAGGKQGAFSILQPADTSPFKVENANVWMWTDRAFVSQSLADLKSGVTIIGNQVKNGTPFDLDGVVWVQDHQVRSLGKVKSGQSASIPQNATQEVESAELLGAVVSASRLEDIFDTKTISNGIPVKTLSAALGEGYGLQNEGAVLIGWAKKPFAPLDIGVGGARPNDLTLVVLRVPRSLTGPLASREATVARVSDPSYRPGQSPNAPRPSIYNCMLHPAKSWQLSVRGTGAYPSSYPGAPPSLAPIDKNRPKAPRLGVTFEVWDNPNNRWVELHGNLSRDDSPVMGWKYNATITSVMPRQPDLMLKLRLTRADNNTQISKVTVVSN